MANHEERIKELEEYVDVLQGQLIAAKFFSGIAIATIMGLNSKRSKELSLGFQNKIIKSFDSLDENLRSRPLLVKALISSYDSMLPLLEKSSSLEFLEYRLLREKLLQDNAQEKA